MCLFVPPASQAQPGNNYSSLFHHDWWQNQQSLELKSNRVVKKKVAITIIIKSKLGRHMGQS